MKERTFRPFTNYRHTAIRNEVFDYILPNVTLSEWAVLSMMIRKIAGWGKESDKISYSQFLKGTPIKSSTTLSTALSGLVEKGLVLRTLLNNKSTMEYKLNTDVEFVITDEGEVIM